MKKWGWLIVMLVAAGVIAYRTARVESPTVPATRGPAGAASEGPEARRPAPDFELTDLAGNSISRSGLKGKVVLLDFWATWCPPCRAEVPHFKELHDEYADQGLEIVGVSVDEGGEAVVRPFVEANGIEYATAMSNDEIVRAFGGIRGIPTTFMIDKEGRISRKYVGYQDKAVFEEEIRKLLAE